MISGGLIEQLSVILKLEFCEDHKRVLYLHEI